MTTHPTPAERLLSMLEEDGAVEALPANEVRNGLAALGVDPARSIAIARALARSDSPGGRLMGALLAGEEDDQEVARIESADIEAVRAQVHHGAAAAIAAEARRKAGVDDNVVGLAERRRKRRRRLAVWGGPLAGIAASLLVVVFFMGDSFLSSKRVEISDEIGGRRLAVPRPEMPDPAMEGYTKPGPDLSLADELMAQGLPPKAESAGRAKEKTFADGSPAAPPAAPEKKIVAPPEAPVELRKLDQFAAAPPPATAAPSRERTNGGGVAGLSDSLDEVAVGGEADIAADNEPGAPVRQSNDAPTLPGIVVPPSGYLAGEEFRAETEIAVAPAADGDTAIAGVNRVEISGIAAVLVLDPSQTPLQVQSQILPVGGLADRVEEARRLAGDRPVIALYTIATGPARRDFAQVPLRSGFVQQFAAPSPMVGLLGVEATEYDFIALPME